MKDSCYLKMVAIGGEVRGQVDAGRADAAVLHRRELITDLQQSHRRHGFIECAFSPGSADVNQRLAGTLLAGT